MAFKSRDGTLEGPPHQPAQDSQFSSLDELIDFAQGYFRSDFPNPEGLDCPIKGSLPGFVRSGRIPDDRLRSHLFGCSGCFGEYQNALATYREEKKSVAVTAESDSWWIRLLATLSLRPIPVFAGVLSLALFAFVGAYVSREYRTPPEQIVARRHSAPIVAPAENPSSNNLPAEVPGASPSPPRAIKRIRPEPFPQPADRKAPVPRQRAGPSMDGELIVRAIDLSNYTTTRGSGGMSTATQSNVLKDQAQGPYSNFPAARVMRTLDNKLATKAGNGGELTVSGRRARFLFTLPEGSAKGFYTISVVRPSVPSVTVTSVVGATVTRSRLRKRPGRDQDPLLSGASRLGNKKSGKTRVVARAQSTDGKTLATTIKMKGLASQKYILRISRESEPPIDVPIVVRPLTKPLEADSRRRTPGPSFRIK